MGHPDMRRRAMLETPVAILPAGYQAVDHINMKKNCYMDLGSISYSDPGFYVDFDISERYNAYGPHVISTSNNYILFNPRSSSHTRAALKGTEGTSGGHVYLNYRAVATLNINSDGVFTVSYADQTETFTITAGSAASGNVYLCAYASSITDTKYHLHGNIYSIKLYDGGVLMKDLVPCIRTADSKAGLYDVVNDVYYGNIGSGTIGV